MMDKPESGMNNDELNAFVQMSDTLLQLAKVIKGLSQRIDVLEERVDRINRLKVVQND